MKIKFLLFFAFSISFANSWEEDTFLSINDVRHPVLDWSASALSVSQAIPPVSWLYLTWEAYSDSGRNLNLKEDVWYSALGAITVFTATQILKLSVQRERPYLTVPEATGSYENGVITKLIPSERHSFPSFASSSAFYSANYFSSIWGGDIYWYSWATLIAWSRVYQAAHYPSDVLVGAFLGIACAQGTLWLKQNTQWFTSFQIQPNNDGLKLSLNF